MGEFANYPCPNCYTPLYWDWYSDPCPICGHKPDSKYCVCSHCEAERDRITTPADYYPTFDAYVADYPEAERYRRWVTNDGRQPVTLIQGDGVDGFLPGGYLWISVCNFADRWRITVHNNDDGETEKYVDDSASMLKELDTLCRLAPVSRFELTPFGYK